MKDRITYLLEGQYELLNRKKEVVPTKESLEEIQQKFNNTMEILIEEMENWNEERDGKNWDATLEQITIDFMGVLNRTAYSYRTKEEKEQDMKVSILNSIFKSIRWGDSEGAKEETEVFNKKFNTQIQYSEGMGVEEFDREVMKELPEL